MTGQEKFPWPRAMQTGLGLLGLSPQQFWSLTPKELAAAATGLAGGNGTPAISRADLDRLVNQFPDEVIHG